MLRVLLMTCLLSIGNAYGGVTGDGNALESALSITWNGTTDPLYPLTNLRLGVTRQPWKAAAVGTDQVLTIDLRRYSGGGFEGASAGADGWTPSVGTPTKSTAQHHSGLASVLLNDNEKLYRERRVKAGSHQILSTWMLSPTSQTGIVYVYNRATRHFLGANGIWTSATVPYGRDAQSSWGQIAGSDFGGGPNPPKIFMVESAAIVGGNHCTLQIILEADGGDVYFDDVDLCPACNALVVAGHNLTPAIDVELSGGTLGLAPVPQVGAFYAYDPTTPATAHDADMDITFNGTPEDPISIGALWLGWMEEITPPRREHTMDVRFRQQEKSGFVLEQSTQEQRTLPLAWEFGEGDGLTPREAYEAFRDAFLRPARGQAYPFAIVWDLEDEPGGVMLARLEEKGWSVTREGTLWKVSATVVEMELPAATS